MADETPEQIRRDANYIDNAVTSVSIFGWGGPFLLFLTPQQQPQGQAQGQATQQAPAPRSIMLQRTVCFWQNDPFTGKVEIALTGIYQTEQAALGAINNSPTVTQRRDDFVVYAHYRGPENVILPTIVSATTCPRMTPALAAAIQQEGRDADAASRTLIEVFLTAAGLRGAGAVRTVTRTPRPGPPPPRTAAGAGGAGATTGGSAAGNAAAAAAASAPRAVFNQAQMLQFVMNLWRNTPVLQRLRAARSLSGQAQHRELLAILDDFQRTTRVTVQRVPEGAVQATRGSGNFASLRSRPGFLQIEEQVFRNTDTLLREVTHELPYHFTGVNSQPMLGSSGIKAHEILEWVIMHGEEAVRTMLTP